MAAFEWEDLEINGHTVSGRVEGDDAANLGPKILEHLKELDNQQRLGDLQ